MSAEKIIKLNTAVPTSCSAYHAYTTSAIQANTQRYVILASNEMLKLNAEETGKYSVFDIANWFLSKKEMTQKKMQKLCYYAQAWCYALKGYRLEDTDYQAWVHGPVSPALWERFKAFGDDPIKMKGIANSKIAPEDKRLLEDVWDTYGDNTGNALETLTQRELPWLEARCGYEPDERCRIAISPTAMASYYQSIYASDRAKF